jgi:hypothetical protein
MGGEEAPVDVLVWRREELVDAFVHSDRVALVSLPSIGDPIEAARTDAVQTRLHATRLAFRVVEVEGLDGHSARGKPQVTVGPVLERRALRDRQETLLDGPIGPQRDVDVIPDHARGQDVAGGVCEAPRLTQTHWEAIAARHALVWLGIGTGGIDGAHGIIGSPIYPFGSGVPAPLPQHPDRGVAEANAIVARPSLAPTQRGYVHTPNQRPAGNT